MSALSLLDVVIGLSVVYLLLSIVCSAVNELLATLTNGRGQHLAAGIAKMLGDDELQERFYAHSVVQSLSDGGRKPSYIAASTFSLVLLDVIAPASADWSRTPAQIGEKIDRLPEDSPLRRTLTLLMDRAGADLPSFQHEIETWFDSVMARVSGWYKRSANFSLLAIALVVTVLANADTLRLTHDLSQNAAMRQALVSYAQQTISRPPPGMAAGDTSGTVPIDSALVHVTESINRVRGVGIPLGWSRAPRDLAEIVNSLIGLLITMFAVALGSPFWFDVLNKLVNLRAAGPPPKPAGKPAEGS